MICYDLFKQLCKVDVTICILETRTTEAQND